MAKIVPLDSIPKWRNASYTESWYLLDEIKTACVRQFGVEGSCWFVERRPYSGLPTFIMFNDAEDATAFILKFGS